MIQKKIPGQQLAFSMNGDDGIDQCMEFYSMIIGQKFKSTNGDVFEKIDNKKAKRFINVDVYYMVSVTKNFTVSLSLII